MALTSHRTFGCVRIFLESIEQGSFSLAHNNIMKTVEDKTHTPKLGRKHNREI